MLEVERLERSETRAIFVLSDTPLLLGAANMRNLGVLLLLLGAIAALAHADAGSQVAHADDGHERHLKAVVHKPKIA